MEKRYSAFWIDYCNGVVDLNKEFAHRDQMYYDESEHNHLNIRGRVNTVHNKKYVSGADIFVCDIEGNQV